MMISTPALVAFLVAYVIFCGMVMYFCVIADPSTSPMAHTIQVVLPNKLWDNMGKVVGKEQMNVVQSLLDLALVIVYFFVVLGCWTVVFWYIYPWVDRSPSEFFVHVESVGFRELIVAPNSS